MRVNVVIVELNETFPGTPSILPKRKGYMGSLKVTEIEVATGTPVAPFDGLTDTTVGLVVSIAVPVVKVQVKVPDMAFPERSLIPVIVPV